MKVRTYGALMGALLIISGTEAAEADGCADCLGMSKPHHVSVERHAPAPAPKHIRNADAEMARSLRYAQSGYDYQSSSQVGRGYILYPQQQQRTAWRDDGWRLAPNDARIRFSHEQRVVYVPVATVSVMAPPPERMGMRIDDRGFDGGVGYGAEGGGGGGGGTGQAFVYGQSNQNGAGNNGDFGLNPGYGRDMYGNWQGYVPPGQRPQPASSTPSSSSH